VIFALLDPDLDPDQDSSLELFRKQGIIKLQQDRKYKYIFPSIQRSITIKSVFAVANSLLSKKCNVQYRVTYIRVNSVADPDPGSGIRDPGETVRIRDPGWKKVGSGINIPDPQHCRLEPTHGR
jgi:hypothetical protein